ncbi:unnamed protein product [Rhodiola kirilowii]
MGDAEVQKMTEMKKAYANIILHTAQEAAVRIMVLESKAFRFQKQAADAKEEALGMLLRLKQTMDSKMHEAEVLSFGDKKKIKELEGQLQEAENIVTDLREELASVRGELEKEKKRERSQSPNGKWSNHLANESECAETSHNAKADASESILQSCSNSKLSANMTSDGKKATPAQRKYERRLNEITDSALTDHFGGVPYLPSIIKRTKLPLIHGNGFTRGICGPKGNKLGGTFCSSDEIAHSKKNSTVDSMMLDLPSENENTSCGGKEVQGELMTSEAGFNHNIPDKPFHGERRGHVEYVKGNGPLYEHLPTWDSARHETTGHCSSISPSYGISLSEENSVKCSKTEAQKAIESLLPTETRNLKTQPVYIQAKENNVDLVRACSFRKTSGNEEKDAIDLTREEGGVVKPLAAKVGAVNLDFDFDIVTCNSNAGADNIKSNKGSFPFTTDIIQYTRKRSRKATDSANCDKEDGRIDLLPYLDKKPFDCKLSKNWESQSVAQVAQQLLALSDKKWFR